MNENLVDAYIKLCTESDNEEFIKSSKEIMDKEYNEWLSKIKAELPNFEFEEIDNFLGCYKYVPGKGLAKDGRGIETQLKYILPNDENYYSHSVILFSVYICNEEDPDEAEYIDTAAVSLDDNSDELFYSKPSLLDLICTIKELEADKEVV